MQKRNDGHIVATSSVAAYTCSANIVPYAATKYGVTGEETTQYYQYITYLYNVSYEVGTIIIIRLITVI